MHMATSFLDLREELIHILTLWNIFWNICTGFSFSLLGHTGLLWDSQQHFVRLLLVMFFSTVSWVPVPGWFLYGCLGHTPWLFYSLHGH